MAASKVGRGRRPRRTARKAGRKPVIRARKTTARKPGTKGVRRAAARMTRSTARKGTGRTAGRPKPRVRAAAVSRGKSAHAAGVIKVPARAAKVRTKAVSQRVQKLRAMLEAKGAEVLEKIKRARADSLQVDRTSFAEVGDLVSASVEKEKAFEYGEAGVNALREIATALEKLKEGTYGVCERCGKPIGVKRLEAMPSARLCVKCKAKEEATGKAVAAEDDTLFED